MWNIVAQKCNILDFLLDPFLLTFFFSYGADPDRMDCPMMLSILIFIASNVRQHWSSSHEMLDDVDGHGEDDGGVVLGRDCGEGLQVSAIQTHDDIRENTMMVNYIGNAD